jgi:DNA-binding NarL/FixJ family response regulator
MILIVDDNSGVRRMVRNMIEDIDSEILECADGSAATAIYETLKPDFVLMDINMQPVDGLTAMRAILEKDPDARIVIVSQHQDARTRSTALAMGAYAFVGKEDLMSVRDLINERVQTNKKATND